nr:inactive carboxypeptidase-like protein X2 [Lytechinus pictus]
MTQGRRDLWLWPASFRVIYSSDEVTWFSARNLDDNEIFTGNNNQDGVYPNYFRREILARYVRVTDVIMNPSTWEVPCLRLELIGVRYETDMKVLEIPSPAWSTILILGIMACACNPNCMT